MDTLFVILITLASLNEKHRPNRFDTLVSNANRKFDNEIFIPVLEAIKKEDEYKFQTDSVYIKK